MADQTITKTHKNKDGTVVSKTYRVDPEFIPTSINDICEEFMINYVIATGNQDWLAQQYKEKEDVIAKKTTKNRKAGEKYQQSKSFMSIRSAFAEKFFKITKSDTSTLSLREQFLRKYGNI